MTLSNGITPGRPDGNVYVSEHNDELLKVLSEEDLTGMSVITEIDFGHNCLIFTIPYGSIAQIDSMINTFSLLESGVEE